MTKCQTQHNHPSDETAAEFRGENWRINLITRVSIKTNNTGIEVCINILTYSTLEATLKSFLAIYKIHGPFLNNLLKTSLAAGSPCVRRKAARLLSLKSAASQLSYAPAGASHKKYQICCLHFCQFPAALLRLLTGQTNATAASSRTTHRLS